MNDNIYFEILSHIDPFNIVNYCLVCKKWNDILKSEILWNIFVNKFIDEEIIRICKIFSKNYKKIFIKYDQLLKGNGNILIPKKRLNDSIQIELKRKDDMYGFHFSPTAYAYEGELNSIKNLDEFILKYNILYLYIPIDGFYHLSIHKFTSGFTLKDILILINKIGYSAMTNFRSWDQDSMWEHFMISYYIKNNHIYIELDH